MIAATLMPPKPKLRRRLLACLTILSLLLCPATVGLWVRSYWRHDVVRYARQTQLNGQGLSVGSTFGQVSVGSFQFYGNFVELGLSYSAYHGQSQRDLRKGWVATGPEDRAVWFFGFGYLSQGRYRAEIGGSAITFPHWFLALLFAILPAIRLRSIIRNRRRNRAGLCPACGYDLRATPDRCPECGRAAGGSA